MELKNDKAKVSYIIGEDIGNSFLREGYDLDLQIMIEALKSAAEGKLLDLLTDEDKNAVMGAWQQEMQGKKQASMKQAGLKAREEGELFLRANREKDGVIETPSGLQYQVEKEGEGAKPKSTDTVNVHYHA